MKKIRNFALACVSLVLLAVLSGCLQSHISVRVQPNGSGSIEQRWAMSEEIVQMMAGFQTMGEEEAMEGDQAPEFSPYDADEVAESAAGFGEGVEFIGLRPIEEPGWVGYVANFYFDDINKLRLDQNPDSPDQSEEEGSPTEFVTFSHSRAADGTATLTIFLPQVEASGADGSADGAEAPPEDMPAEMASVMEFYRGVRIAMDIEFQGRIVSTDAEHRQGEKITLLDADFGRILEDPQSMGALMALQGDGDMGQLKAALGDVPGLSFESKPQLTVTYR